MGTIIQSATHEVNSAKKDLQKYDRAQVELKETEKFLTQKRKKLAKALHADTLKKSEDDTWVANFEADVAKSELKVAEANARLSVEEAKLNEIQSELQGKTSGIQKQIVAKQILLAPLLEKLNGVESQLGVASSERQMLSDKIDAADNATALATENLAEMSNSLEDKNVNFCQERRTLAELVNNMDKKNAEQQVRAHLTQKLKLKQTNYQKQAMEATSQLNEMKNSFNSSKDRGKVYSQLMAQKKSNKIKGIFVVFVLSRAEWVISVQLMTNSTWQYLLRAPHLTLSW